MSSLVTPLSNLSLDGSGGSGASRPKWLEKLERIQGQLELQYVSSSSYVIPQVKEALLIICDPGKPHDDKVDASSKLWGDEDVFTIVWQIRSLDVVFQFGFLAVTRDDDLDKIIGDMISLEVLLPFVHNLAQYFMHDECSLSIEEKQDLLDRLKASVCRLDTLGMDSGLFRWHEVLSYLVIELGEMRFAYFIKFFSKTLYQGVLDFKETVADNFKKIRQGERGISFWCKSEVLLVLLCIENFELDKELPRITESVRNEEHIPIYVRLLDKKYTSVRILLKNHFLYVATKIPMGECPASRWLFYNHWLGYLNEKYFTFSLEELRNLAASVYIEDIVYCCEPMDTLLKKFISFMEVPRLLEALRLSLEHPWKDNNNLFIPSMGRYLKRDTLDKIVAECTLVECIQAFVSAEGYLSEAFVRRMLSLGSLAEVLERYSGLGVSSQFPYQLKETLRVVSPEQVMVVDTFIQVRDQGALIAVSPLEQERRRFMEILVDDKIADTEKKRAFWGLPLISERLKDKEKAVEEFIALFNRAPEGYKPEILEFYMNELYFLLPRKGDPVQTGITWLDHLEEWQEILVGTWGEALTLYAKRPNVEGLRLTVNFAKETDSVRGGFKIAFFKRVLFDRWPMSYWGMISSPKDEERREVAQEIAEVLPEDSGKRVSLLVQAVERPKWSIAPMELFEAPYVRNDSEQYLLVQAAFDTSKLDWLSIRKSQKEIVVKVLRRELGEQFTPLAITWLNSATKENYWHLLRVLKDVGVDLPSLVDQASDVAKKQIREFVGKESWDRYGNDHLLILHYHFSKETFFDDLVHFVQNIKVMSLFFLEIEEEGFGEEFRTRLKGIPIVGNLMEEEISSFIQYQNKDTLLLISLYVSNWVEKVLQQMESKASRVLAKEMTHYRGSGDAKKELKTSYELFLDKAPPGAVISQLSRFTSLQKLVTT